MSPAIPSAVASNLTWAILPLEISMVDEDKVCQSSPETSLCKTKVTLPVVPLFLDVSDNETDSPGLGVGLDHSQVVSASLRLTSGPVSANGQDAKGCAIVLP